MECIVCNQPGSLSKVRKQSPRPLQGMAIIEMKRIGICGTDLHAWKGEQPFFQYPRILGHELAGIVKWIDESCVSIKKGDQVTVIPYLECGKCNACKSGKTNCCIDMKVLGVHLDGGMCEQLIVPNNHLITTNELTLEETAVIEPLSIGAHAIRRAELCQNEMVLVIGAGPIGLGVMALAKQEGVKVIAMDVDENRLKVCREWAGVDHTVNAYDEPLEVLSDLTDGNYPEVVFDATGNKQSMNKAFQYTAFGGKLIYVGLVRDYITFYDPDFHSKELSLLASRNATLEDFKYVKQMIATKRIKTTGYITQYIPFRKTIDTFHQLLESNEHVIKAMIVVNGDSASLDHV